VVGIPVEILGENIVNKIHNKYLSAFVGYLYSFGPDECRTKEHVKPRY